MRSVPHRVVCLLGLDDGVFPRKAPRDGDDLMLDDPHVGERDARTEDRQLLLDALMAATDRLIVTYTGNDERTNLATPPAVPVGELLDVVERSGVPARGGRRPPSAAAVRPAQLHRPALGSRGASTDRRSTAPARWRRAPAAGAVPRGPAAGVAEPVVELDDLVRFVEQPVRAFLRQRLGISAGDYADEVEDALPVELDPLEAWGSAQRLLEARLAGAEARTAIRAEIARGTLPPRRARRAGDRSVLPGRRGDRRATCRRAELGRRSTSRSRSPGRTLRGTVPGVAGDLLRTVTYAR